MAKLPPYTVSSFTTAAAASTLSIASTLTPELATIISTYFTIRFYIATCSVDYNTETSGGEVIQLTSRFQQQPSQSPPDILH